ncbi:MAG: DNA primase [Fimbriimonadaceae bacterium]
MAGEREEIRARISIVELVGQRVSLKRTGKDWKGLCPFHPDKNPSFSVSETTGRYRCWSCGETGDVFSWVMKTQNVDFPEALEILARQAGVELTPRAGAPDHSLRVRQLAAMEEALKFFREQLVRSREALGYVERRGLDQEILDAWEIGYAPADGSPLSRRLGKAGFPLEMCRDLFLVDQSGSGYRDKFFNRLMFPIRNERGELVAFGGRVLGDGHPKYINSGDTPIFRKSRVLYGMFRAREAMRRRRYAVLVEGYLDVIACHRAGVDTAVASLGTALAEEHAQLLRRWVDEVTIFYDGDPAGRKAAERACEVLAPTGLRVRVALLRAGDDPDTLLRDSGPKAVRDAAESGVSPLEFRIRTIESSLKPSDEAFWSQMVDALAGSAIPTETERFVTEIAARYLSGQSPGGARETLYGRIRERQRELRMGAKRVERPGRRLAIGTPALSSQEAQIVRCLLEPALAPDAWRVMREEGLFYTALGKRVAESVARSFPDAPPSGPAATWLGTVDDEEIRQAIADTEFGLHLLASESALESAAAYLRRERDSRALETIKAGDGGDERLRKIQERLQNLKET